MSSGSRSAIGAIVAALACAPCHARELRVCADPDNLPLSHADGSGFENRIAEVVAAELGATLRYEWLAQRRGFVRKTMGAGLCDLFVGVPKGFERVLTTRPYYRSTYVFVAGEKASGIDAFDDPRLARLRVGVQLPGDDLAATPAGHALAARGLVDNVRGMTPYGEPPAQQRLVAAVAAGELDLAVVWGPLAGDLARRAGLAVRPAKPLAELSPMPFEFAISMGVRKGDKALRDELDGALERRRSDIDAILAAYSVPRVDR